MDLTLRYISASPIITQRWGCRSLSKFSLFALKQSKTDRAGLEDYEYIYFSYCETHSYKIKKIYIMVTKVNIYIYIYSQTMAHLHGGATMWINACTNPLHAASYPANFRRKCSANCTRRPIALTQLSGNSWGVTVGRTHSVGRAGARFIVDAILNATITC